MNPSNPPPAAPRRRLWPWVLGFCLAPFVVLGLAAASYLTLDRDAAALRKQVMAASQADWDTKVQFSVGRATLGAVRTGLWFADAEHIDEARLALGAVRHASVGVYELASSQVKVSREEMILATDRTMKQRGWSRLVGVVEAKETVLVYVSDEADEDAPLDVCLAVVDGRDLVVVSTSLSGDALEQLIRKTAGPEIRKKLKLHARL